MLRHIWLNHAHSSQRDVASLMRSGGLGGAVNVTVSHKEFREDIFLESDGYFIEPSGMSEEDFDYAEWALNTAAAKGFVGLLAMRQRRALLKLRDQFDSQGIRLAAGAVASNAIDLCDHKDAFTDLVKANGIPVAETISVTSAEELREAIVDIEQISREVCIKPVVGVYGRGFWKFRRGVSPFDLFSKLEPNVVDPDMYIDAFGKAENPSKQIVMAYLSGIESSVDAVCDNGRIVSHAVRQKFEGHQIVFTGGPELDIAQAVAQIIGLDGLVNIQTKADASGIPNVLEVNTRPSGGVGFSAAAGINLPHDCAMMMLGERVQPPVLNSPVAVRRIDTTIKLPEMTARLKRVQAA
ncbi:ATP-grasp domain-containing protein [Mesorhizobium sp. M0808]|uniref:ATP-grasp domain-containing protein n=1 Tax=Mesorhizobium sp. M0808 TaxID=2957002 RepID=UPI0033399FFF